MPTLPSRRRLVQIAAAAVGLAVLVAGAYLAVGELTGGDEDAPAPPLRTQPEEEPEAAEELGFPAFATKNTTRVGGGDAVADAAGVALATHPSTGGVEGPAAVALVPSDDWAAGIAASALVADPVGAPILVGDADEVSSQTETALEALSPDGSEETREAQLLRIGDVRVPGGMRTVDVAGGTPAEIAAAVHRLRARLADDDPDHVVIASAQDPAYAMPAAAWAARSGDPVLFVERDSVPEPTTRALERHEDVPAFVLGPESAISDDVIEEIEETASEVQRIAGDSPAANAVAFARFREGAFGWGLTDPGHGLVVANASRPLDAAAAAPLSAAGKWGPLLLSESATEVPAALRGFLLDIKPGYRADPTRAFYNHAWLIGNTTALSVAFQAEVDDLLELVRIQPPAREQRNTEREP